MCQHPGPRVGQSGDVSPHLEGSPHPVPSLSEKGYTHRKTQTMIHGPQMMILGSDMYQRIGLPALARTRDSKVCTSAPRSVSYVTTSSSREMVYEDYNMTAQLSRNQCRWSTATLCLPSWSMDYRTKTPLPSCLRINARSLSLMMA